MHCQSLSAIYFSRLTPVSYTHLDVYKRQILAVVVLYFPKLWPFCSPKNGWIKKDTWILWFKVIVAALPAAIIGLPFDDLLDKLFYNYQTVAVTLILYGVLFIVVENYNKKRRPRIKSLESLPWSTALLIGCLLYTSRCV